MKKRGKKIRGIVLSEKSSRSFMAWRIANDIAEGIDNRETRAKLRECIATLADEYYSLMTAKKARQDSQDIAKFVEAVKQMHEIATMESKFQKFVASDGTVAK